jgi:hypothetical protein
LKVLPEILVGCEQYWPENGKANSGANAPTEMRAIKALPKSPGTAKINNCQTDI